MKRSSLLSVSFLILFILPSWGKPLKLSKNEINTPPPRIVRVCCSLGSDFRYFGVPYYKVNQLTNFNDIGPHHYLGNLHEKNGILYTHRGGFIDMAHLRDNADWTAYLYAFIHANKKKGSAKMLLGYEGGDKMLYIDLPARMDSSDEIQLAGRIAYELSVWHEISSGFGARAVPFISERYSSFSVEDIYSNLLGVTLGMKAIESDLPYDEAMTQLIAAALDSLGVVKTEAENLMALENVRNLWWSRDARLPSNKVTLERQINIFPTITPVLVPILTNQNTLPVPLDVPAYTHSGLSLNDMFQLKIKLNYRFSKDIWRTITQNDFAELINEVGKELKKSDTNTDDNIKKGAWIRKRRSHRTV